MLAYARFEIRGWRLRYGKFRSHLIKPVYVCMCNRTQRTFDGINYTISLQFLRRHTRAAFVKSSSTVI